MGDHHDQKDHGNRLKKTEQDFYQNLASETTSVLDRIYGKLVSGVVAKGRQETPQNTQKRQVLVIVGLEATKKEKLEKDVLMMLGRLKRLEIPPVVLSYALGLLCRVSKKLEIGVEKSTCSRTTLKYLLLSAVLISSKMLMEDRSRKVAEIAGLFKYEVSRLIETEKRLVIEYLEFNLYISYVDLVREVKFFAKNEFFEFLKSDLFQAVSA